MKTLNKLKSELAVTKKKSTVIWKSNAQYSKQQFLELVPHTALPASVSDSDLEKKVLKIFEKAGYHVEDNNIDACHQLSKINERLIVTFFHRKDSKLLLIPKKDLRNLCMN